MTSKFIVIMMLAATLSACALHPVNQYQPKEGLTVSPAQYDADYKFCWSESNPSTAQELANTFGKLGSASTPPGGVSEGLEGSDHLVLARYAAMDKCMDTHGYAITPPANSCGEK